MARIGFDVDGVIFPFADLFTDFVNDNSEFNFPYPQTWRFFEEWGKDAGWFATWHAEFVNFNGYTSGPLIGGNGTRLALRDLRDAGHEIILVTARKANPGQDENIKAQTIFWLDGEGIPYDELHFSSDKTSVQTDYFIEDRVENFEHILENSDTDAYLLDQPWNRNFEDWHDNFRVGSVLEYVNRILVRESHITSAEAWQAAEQPYVEIAEKCAERCGSVWTQVAEVALGLESDRKEAVNKSEEVRVTNDKTGGAKGAKPARFDLIPADALWELAEHYGKGAAKYQADEDGLENWRNGYNWSLTLAALARHFFSVLNGEDIDEETGSKHIIAVAWHALTLAHFMNREDLREWDDRQATVLARRVAGQ